MAALTRGGTSQAEPIVMTTFYVPLVCSRSQWILHVINPELGAAAFAELVPPPQLLFAFIGRKNSLAPRVLATFFQKRFAWTTVQRTPQNEFSLDINPILVPKLDRNAKIETSYLQFPNFGRLIMKSRAPRPLKMKVYREIIIFFSWTSHSLRRI